MGKGHAIRGLIAGIAKPCWQCGVMSDKVAWELRKRADKSELVLKSTVLTSIEKILELKIGMILLYF